jgi:uncharacterized protein involved in outer membrane biogenesis
MRLWIKLLIGVFALGLLLVAGAALFISQVDPNEYRGVIADAVEHATGRKLQLGGDLHIKFLPVPSVQANDVSFANAPWASQPYMLRAKRVRADVAWLPLLEGKLVIRRFDAMEPQVYLQTDADGKGNWQLDGAGESGTDTQRSSGDLMIFVNELRIENASLSYVDGRTGRTTDLAVAELVAGRERLSKRVAIALSATYQNLPVMLKGKLGEPGAIVKGQPFELDLKGGIGDAEFSIAGAVGKGLVGKDLRLDIELKSPSTKPISDAAGIEFEELGPVDVQLQVVEEGGQLRLDPVKLSARPRGTDARISGSVKNIALNRLFGADAGDAAGKSIDVDLQASLGEARFSVVGDVAYPVDAGTMRLDVSADTRTTQWLTKLAGVELEEIGPIKLSLAMLGTGGRYDLDNIHLTARPRNTDASMRGSIKDLLLYTNTESTKRQPAKVDVQGTLGQAQYSVNGQVAEPMRAKGLRLSVSLDAKSTRALTALADVDVEELGPLGLKLMVTGDAERLDLSGIDLTARPRGARVTITGSIGDVVNKPRPELGVALAAEQLRQLDESLPQAGPVRLSAKVQPSAEAVEIKELVAQVGKSDLSGSASVDTSGERPKAKAKLRSKLMDLTELAPAAKEADSKAGTEKAADGRIFSGNPLPLDVLKKLDADIELAVTRLVTDKLSLDQVDLVAKLDNGNLMVKPAARIAGGTIGGTITIDSRTQPAKFTADVDGSKVSIGSLTKELRGYETSKGLDSNLKMKLQGQGDSMRAIMGELDGDIRLDIGAGSLNNNVLDRVGADLLTQLISVAVPTDEKDKTTAFQCGVVRFAVNKGEAVADQTLVMETDKVLLTGGGLVDLKTEKLDLGAHLVPRKGIRIHSGTLSSLVRVQGTLADPRLGTNLKGVVTTGARVGIAVATGGLSLLAESVYGRLSEDADPCQAALTRKIDTNPDFLKSLLK